ncbi:MAG: CPBP family intramembrane metalloprotease [Treponema sp.]|nr:CPBP family intramembrane metalloprotease [Treponema sp.]
MGIYLEAIILYILLFLSGSIAQLGSQAGGTAQAAEFSAAGDLIRIGLFIIPSLILVWYLILRTWKLEYWVVRPGRKDLLSGLITFPCLLIIGFVITLVSKYAGGTGTQTLFRTPSSAAEWIFVCIICILAAYLEESFFRFYLLTKRKEMNLSSSSALIFSAALFSICHIHMGPWGFLNAALSGVLLGFLFLRYNSLHGIAIAHSLYNISVYIINSFLIN